MKMNKRITAFVCAVVMALGFSSAAFAEHKEKNPEDHGRHTCACEKASENRRSSHKKHKSEHQSRKDRKDRHSEEDFVFEYDDGYPDGDCLINPWDDWDEENRAWDEQFLFAGDAEDGLVDEIPETHDFSRHSHLGNGHHFKDPVDDYALTDDIYADEYYTVPWYSEDYQVEEPTAIVPTWPEEKSDGSDETVQDEGILEAEADVTDPSSEEKEISLSIDLNDEAAVQELFQAFLQWLKENYTVSANKS